MILGSLLKETYYDSRLDLIKVYSEQLFKKDVPNHKNYTLHGNDHSLSVISKLNNLVEGIDHKSMLTVPEIFYLLTSVYLHDVGMLVSFSDDETRANEIKNKKGVPYSKEELIRDNHNFRSGSYIDDHLDSLNFDHVESECIKLICKGHRLVDLTSNDYKDRFVKDECIRVRLLAALLRLADELDVDYSRAPKKLMDLLFQDMSEFSKLQWLKHYYTNGVRISSQEINGKRKTVVEIQTQYPDLEKGRKITDELIIKPIKKTFQTVDRILLEVGLNIYISNPDVFLNKKLDPIPKEIYDKYLCNELKVSMQVPQTKGFVGRSLESVELLNLLNRNIIVIEGIAGIGKTYLASKFAEQIKDEYNIFWYESLSEFTSVNSIIIKISLFLKENGKDTLYKSIELGYETDILIDVLRNELKANKLAIFFDNYQKAKHEINSFFEQLTSIEPSKIILITSVKPAFYDIIHEKNNAIGKLEVKPWGYSDTCDMFKNRLIDTSDESVLNEIHKRLHGHPQYLNLFCVLSEKLKPFELLMKLPEAEEDAREYLEHQVYDSLKESEQTLIQIISVYRIPEKIDAFYITTKLKQIETVLKSLINKFLINEVGADKYIVHDIVSSYCLNDTKKKKIIQYYHGNAAKYYLSKDDNPESLLEASYHYNQAGEKEKATDLICMNSDVLIDKGFWNIIENQLTEAIKNLSKRKHDRNANSKAGFMNLRIARFYAERGDFKLALEHADECLNCFTWAAAKDMFSLYTLYGDVYKKIGEISESEKNFFKSLQHAKDNGDEYSQAIANANLGTIYVTKADYKKALELYLESDLIFEAHNCTKNLAISNGNISTVYYLLDDLDKAYTYICKSCDLYREIGATYMEAKVYNDYALLCIENPTKIDELNEILLNLKKNADLFDKIGDSRDKLIAYSRIALIHRIQKNYQLHTDYYKKMEETLEELIKKEYNLMDELQLCEVYINLYAFEEAEKIITKLLNKVDNNYFYKPVIIIYSSLISFLTDKETNAFSTIEELTQKESILNKKCEWEFISIMSTIKENLKNPEYILISDLMDFVKNKTKFPLIRFEYVKIINEEPGNQTEVFHPFIGYKKITKEDTFYRSIIELLKKGETIIDADCAEIMNVERNSALMTLGYLYKKDYIVANELSTTIFKIGLTSSAMNRLTAHKKLKYSVGSV